MTNEEINLAVAVIAGWTEIENWNTSATKKTYIGTNATRPELGKFIPEYTKSLDAIALVYLWVQRQWNVSVAWDGRRSYASSFDGVGINHGSKIAETPALALCKLLLAINPAPIAPPVVAIIDDDGEHD
jgi:hypothetical protein